MTRQYIFEEREKELKKLMNKLKIFDHDIKESFIKSSGPGGQNVNKVSTCVALTHVPTGIQVKCQETRSQINNRYKARHLLVKKIEQKVHEEKLKEVQKREKIKRQKRKRPGYLKEEILEKKHIRSEKKEGRKKIKTYQADEY